MTEQTQEDIERELREKVEQLKRLSGYGKEAYELIVQGSKNLRERVSAHQGITNFDNFIACHNSLLEAYIVGFDFMDTEQCERANYLLNQTKQYVHGVLDVERVRSMRSAMIRPSRKR
jgi:hypothetical protein